MRFVANIYGHDVHTNMNLTVYEWIDYRTVEELEKLKKEIEDFKDNITALCDDLLYDIYNITRVRAKEAEE